MKIMLQIGLVFGICLLGQIIADLLPIAFPGSVISMILLFLLLVFRIVKVDHIQKKADFLLKNMAFFFIPAGVGIVAEFDAIKNSIPALLVVVVITTVLTFGSTALVVQGIISLQDRLERRRQRKGRPS
jgi:holin-like protein